MSEIFQIFGFVISISLAISIAGTFFFLYKFNVSNTAWIYTALAGIAFFYAGVIQVMLSSTATIVYFSWATPLGIPGGYILIFQAIYQYSLDKGKIKKRVSISNDTEPSDVVPIQ